jgi:sugar lactone lactonase YvrE
MLSLSRSVDAIVVGLTVAFTTVGAFAQHNLQVPDNPAFSRMPKPSAVNGPLETMLELNLAPGNPAVSPAGRLYFSLHPFGDPEIRVAEVLQNGGLRAYPTDDWSHEVGPNGIGIQSIIGLKCDAKGILWMLDAGNLGAPNGTPPKLIAWDTVGERLSRVVHLPPPITSAKSFLQDLAIDASRETLYIADSGIGSGFQDAAPGIVVVYLRTGVARRVLDGATCVRPEAGATMVIDGKEVGVSGEGAERTVARVGVNPITIDDKSEWVYFGAMHGTSLWKVKADDLANPGLPPAELEARVVRHGDKPVSDGITIDSAGNVYVTDLTSHAIGVVEPSGSYRVLFRDDALLQWPDGMCAGHDGKIYVSVNQLNRQAALNQGRADVTPPYRLLRFTPLAPATLGR